MKAIAYLNGRGEMFFGTADSNGTITYGPPRVAVARPMMSASASAYCFNLRRPAPPAPAPAVSKPVARASTRTLVEQYIEATRRERLGLHDDDDDQAADPLVKLADRLKGQASFAGSRSAELRADQLKRVKAAVDRFCAANLRERLGR